MENSLCVSSSVEPLTGQADGRCRKLVSSSVAAAAAAEAAGAAAAAVAEVALEAEAAAAATMVVAGHTQRTAQRTG